MRTSTRVRTNRSHRRHAIAAGVVALAALAASSTADAAASGTWTPTATTPLPRAKHVAARLNDGRVLVAGGTAVTSNSNGAQAFTHIAAAQIYDPTHDTWATTGSLARPRERAAAATLTDGQVLLAGGLSGTTVLKSTEIYNPVTGAWTAGPSTLKAREDNTAIRLADGRVLVAGIEGASTFSGPTSAEIYNPKTNKWTATGPTGTSAPTYPIRGVLLPDGRALTTIGIGSAGGPDVYNPATNAWQRLPASPVALGYDVKLALLPNGHVLFAGGVTPGFFGDEPANTAAELDPTSGAWTPRPAPTLASTFDQQSLATVAAGEALLAGGLPNGLDADYLYDPTTGTWSTIAGGTRSLAGSTLTTLTDGRALIVGGNDDTAGTPTVGVAAVFQP